MDALSDAKGCIFCRIVLGEAASSIAYEDEETLAFLDMRQHGEGHMLVVPKRHIEDIFALDDATGAALIATIAHVSRAVRDAFAPEGINVWQSNGAAAGQEVFHLHFHVMPRQIGDGLLRVYPGIVEHVPREELDRQAAAIRSAMNRTT